MSIVFAPVCLLVVTFVCLSVCLSGDSGLQDCTRNNTNEYFIKFCEGVGLRAITVWIWNWIIIAKLLTDIILYDWCAHCDYSACMLLLTE